MEDVRAKHVVLFPFPGLGHLAGFLAVTRPLRRELPDATTVTIVSTPRNVVALRSSFEKEESPASNIGFHALPFVPADHGLPPDCESTNSLPMVEFIKLFEAFDALEPAFDCYITSLRGNGGGAANICIVSDVFLAWTVDVARRRGCMHAFFVSCGAFGTAVLHALWKNMPALPFGPDGLLCLPEVPEAGALDRTQLTQPLLHENAKWTAYHHRLIPRGYETDAVLVNTAEELEPTGLAMLRRTLGKVPVWPIGPLVRAGAASDAAADDHGILRWLDAQPPSSVLYVSFGSQNSIRQNQMMELAAALESTGQRFLWAFQPPVGLDVCGASRDDEWLPEGFEARARVGNRALLVRGWAPQVRILAHGATGAFLSHCGWNSVLESLTHGVPVLGWPLAAEQFYNVKMMAEMWGVCVEVARGNMESSVVERSRLVRAVETVMGDTAESRAVRRRVAEVQELLGKAWAEDGGSSLAASLEFLRAMRLR